jgi:ribokinase
LVEVVDTTGAGDSFLGAFAFYLAKGYSYVEAAGFACEAASLSVQSVGAQQSYANSTHPNLKPYLS